MRLIGNVLWLLLSGIGFAITYLIAGLIACLFIVTIPFGVACFRIAGYALWPFGRTVVSDPGSGLFTGLANVVWFIIAGLWIALAHVLTGAVFFLTIIGIPFGIAHFKMAGLALFPLGKRIVPITWASKYGLY